MKNKKKITTLLIIFVIFLEVSCISIGSFFPYLDSGNRSNDKLKKSGYWELFEIYIDDTETGIGAHNWTWVESQAWFGGGNGSKENPYLLENIKVDHQGVSGMCIGIRHSEKHFIIRNCTTIRSAQEAGIFLLNVSNGQLINNNITNCGSQGGINMQDSSHIDVMGNVITNNDQYGIYATGDNITISENIIIGSTIHGISVGSSFPPCEDFEISNNIIENHPLGNGIYCSYLSHANISNNIITNSNLGISTAFVDNINISKNVISINEMYGILFASGSINNTVKDNIVYNSTLNGFRVGGSGHNTVVGNRIMLVATEGLWFESPWNTAYNNFFIDNNVNARDGSSNNKWDNGSIGNYWDDYSGEDADGDGIGDTPYNISGGANNKDYYPIYWKPLLESYVKFVKQSFSATAFDFEFYICNGIEQLIHHATLQMWWNGINVTADIIDIGGGFYKISLAPITVQPGETPILLYMTVSALGYDDTYIETYFAIEPYELNIEIIEKSFSQEHFNITFSIHNKTHYGIDFASIQMWWNTSEVSTDVQNIGGGLYFVSLEAIPVAPGEDPILLNMNITAPGYENKDFETYIAVDPDILQKGAGKPSDELLLPVIMTISVVSVGAIIGLAGIYWVRKRRKEL